MKKLIFLTILLILVIVLIGYILKTRPQSDIDTTKPTVATTIYPIYSLTKEITGDKLNVELIIPVGASEHTYEPSTQDLFKLKSSELLFAIDEKLDNYIFPLAQSANSKIRIVSLSKNVPLISNNEGVDPHYWLSLSNSVIIINTITKELIAKYPQFESKFTQNSQNLINEISNLRSESLGKLNKINNKKIITFHDAFSYFAKDMGLDVIATIEPFPGKEPTITYLQQVGNKIKNLGITSVFKEPQLSDQVVIALATDYNINVNELDPLGGTSGRETYLKLMSYNINSVITTLTNN